MASTVIFDMENGMEMESMIYFIRVIFERVGVFVAGNFKLQ